jgi:anti-sigma B factor antagonist
VAIVGLGIRDYGGPAVVALHGELDVTDARSVMALLTAAAAGNPRIVLDLAALEYIDCYAMGALGQVRAQARNAGGDLLLAAPRGPVRRLLDLTGLISVFAVHASVDEAVRAAGGEPDRRQHAGDSDDDRTVATAVIPIASSGASPDPWGPGR